ncbi:MAG: discoidin domain-containing protein, partial [Candidatus Rokuibacteriota bacterium]
VHGYLTNRYALRGRTKSYMQPYFAAMQEVDLSPRVAFVTHEQLKLPAAAELEVTLRLLGGTYRKASVGQYTVFWDFEPPSKRIQEIPPASITLRASHGDSLAPFALDRHIVSTWKSRTAQVPGIRVEAELDRPRRVAKILLDPGNLVKDYPRGVRVESSPDGRQWRELVSAPSHVGGIDWLGSHPKLNVKGRLGIWVGPVEAKHLRLTQIGQTAEKVNWTIAELLLYEEGPRPWTTEPARFVRADERARLFEVLKAHGVETLYSSDEGHVFFSRYLPPPIRTVALHDKRFEPVERSERIVRANRRNAFFVASESPLLEGDFRKHGIAFEKLRFESGVLYLTVPQDSRSRLYWDYERLLEVTLR